MPSTRNVKEKQKKINIIDSTFHSLGITHFSTVKLLDAVHLTDYLSEQVVLYGTRNTGSFLEYSIINQYFSLSTAGCSHISPCFPLLSALEFFSNSL